MKLKIWYLMSIWVLMIPKDINIVKVEFPPVSSIIGILPVVFFFCLVPKNKYRLKDPGRNSKISFHLVDPIDVLTKKRITDKDINEDNYYFIPLNINEDTLDTIDDSFLNDLLEEI